MPAALPGSTCRCPGRVQQRVPGNGRRFTPQTNRINYAPLVAFMETCATMASNKNGIVVHVDLRVNGVDKKLLAVGPKIARRLMRKALKAVGNFWVPLVKAAAPDLLGDLKDSIGMKARTKKGGTIGIVEVGPDMRHPRSDGKSSVGPGIYALWVEFGLRLKQYAANPFMRRVYDSTAEKAQAIFAETLRDGLEETLKD